MRRRKKLALYHIYPINDIKEHTLEGKSCECNPTIEVTKRKKLIIHNSYDGREAVEMANEILNKKAP